MLRLTADQKIFLHKARQLMSRRAVQELSSLLSQGEDPAHPLSELITKQLHRISTNSPVEEKIVEIGRNVLERTMLTRRFLSGSVDAQDLSLDSLAEGIAPTAASLTIHFANLITKKEHDCSLVTSVRNEGPWLLEWIAHHKAAGIKDIFIFHNDVDDGSQELIRALDERGVIHSIANSASDGTSPQRKAYNFACHLVPLIHRSRWVGFLDADEYMWPLEEGCETVVESLDRIASVSARPVDSVQVHWKWYSSPDIFNWIDQPVTRRFRHFANNSHTKAIVNTDSLWSMERIHYPTLGTLDPVVSNSEGKVIPALTEEIEPPTYRYLQVNHYFAKSFEEFILKKSRGRGAFGRTTPQRDFDSFLWGSPSEDDCGLPNPDIQGRTDDLISTYLQDADIRRAHAATNRIAREKLRQIDSEWSIGDTYRRLFRR